ncbi:MAG: riboflavin synthase [Deltaproteobacteria bacterium]|nr:riboflavin synthase [Deltaproteobacteria bacterium]
MFTGIIEAIGTVKSIEKTGGSGRITIEAKGVPMPPIGGSIAVNGSCLTATAISGSSFTADVSSESFKRTTLGLLKTGDSVNIELPLTMNKPLGGHFVTGHVDYVGEVVAVKKQGDFSEFEFSIKPGFENQFVEKGSVAIDGISLTISKLSEKTFTVAVIPHTLTGTTLASKKQGQSVNIETDVIGKYVERFMNTGKEQGVTEGFLREHGFLKRG